MPLSLYTQQIALVAPLLVGAYSLMQSAFLCNLFMYFGGDARADLWGCGGGGCASVVDYTSICKTGQADAPYRLTTIFIGAGKQVREFGVLSTLFMLIPVDLFDR